MKLPFGKERPLVITVATTLLLICAIFALWTGSRVVVIKPIHEGLVGLGDLMGIIDLLTGILFLLSGYFIFQIDGLETGVAIALLLGLLWTMWFYATGPISLAFLFTGIIPIIAGVISLRKQKQIRRQIWLRRIKGFWLDFSHNKIGLLGLAILIFFVAIAILQPILATHDPEQRDLAKRYAMPEWATIFDPTLNLPRTIDYSLEWNWNHLPENVEIDRSGDKWKIRYEGDGTENIVIPLHLKYGYLQDPPESFRYRFTWAAKLRYVDGNATARYSLELKLTTPDGIVYPLWDQHWEKYSKASCQIRNPDWKPGDDPYTLYYPGILQYITYGYQVYEKYGWQIPLWSTNQSDQFVQYSATQDSLKRLGYQPFKPEDMSADLFSPPGENYTLQLYVTIEPTQQNALCEITITSVELHVPGLLWGLLGTEYAGRDCWSRLVYGARVSLAVGISSAVIATLLGVTVGVVAGYYGGIVDEVLMRFVDVLLCLPLLPLLMVLIYLWGRNILYIIFLIAIFGWLGLSRMVRSQVLSLREMLFVESAKASGASRFYIMFKHLVPNVLPLVLTDFILTIPGAILLEAALSFIGFGDPSAPTWGREYSFMQNVGSASTIVNYWWWSLPPGLMITLLCVGFVFLGHAIDEIVNPRLRRRR